MHARARVYARVRVCAWGVRRASPRLQCATIGCDECHIVGCVFPSAEPVLFLSSDRTKRNDSEGSER